MRIGHLNYINAIPLYGKMPKDHLVSGNPAELNAKLFSGDLDVSLISSAEYLKNKQHYDLIPGFGIAAEGPVKSVILYAKEPITEIALTPQSATSVQLVKLLCHNFWHIEPKFVPLPSIEEATRFSAFLLIGDDALRHPTFAGYKAIDLAEVWFEKTHLPIPFAVFAKQKGIEAGSFLDALATSIKWSEERRSEVIQLAHKQSKLPLPLLESYYPLLRYRLGDAELAGLNAFEALCRQTPSLAK